MDIGRSDIELLGYDDRAQDTGCAAADLFRSMADGKAAICGLRITVH